MGFMEWLVTSEGDEVLITLHSPAQHQAQAQTGLDEACKSYIHFLKRKTDFNEALWDLPLYNEWCEKINFPKR